jgi:FKBP-type peptidyl-prolyl cis-trans isomerase (trigger factor)
MFEQLKERTPRMLNMSFDEYLKKLGKTEAELKTSMERENEQKIKNFMVLQEISRLEKIEVNDAEAEEAMKKANDKIEEGGDMKQVKEYYRETLKNEKTFEFLEGLFKK